jgi:DNA polymerase-3 subunit gamma/tau
MASQALYLRWRPLSFDDVVGQEHITYTLRNALISGRVGHAYLFSGPRGTGKTTMARLLAKAVNCLAEDPAQRPCNQCQHCQAVNESRFLDLIEIDAASHTGVDDVRELRDRIAFSPNEGRYKVYIIDEVHRFSGSAFDALLKTIEEPPPHALFVLATTEIHKVPQTILSRCQRFDFRRLRLDEIISRLNLILDAEGIEAEDMALELIARQSTGSMRDAITLLDQLISEQGQVLTLEYAQAILGTADQQAVIDLADALLGGDIARGLGSIHQTLDHGTDPRQFANQMVEHLRRVMLVQTGGQALVEVEVMPSDLEALIAQAKDFPRRALLDSLRFFKEAAADNRSGWQPQLPLELAFVECVEALYAAPQETYSAPPAPGASQPPTPASVPGAPPAEIPSIPEAGGASTAAPTLSLAEIDARWQDVYALARQTDQQVAALLKSGKLFGVEGSAIIYQMPSDMLRDKIEGEQNQQIIEGILSRVFGQSLKLRCTTQTAQTERRTRAADRLVAGDSVISFAVNDLGGSIKPFDDDEE